MQLLAQQSYIWFAAMPNEIIRTSEYEDPKSRKNLVPQAGGPCRYGPYGIGVDVNDMLQRYESCFGDYRVYEFPSEVYLVVLI